MSGGMGKKVCWEDGRVSGFTTCFLCVVVDRSKSKLSRPSGPLLAQCLAVTAKALPCQG